MSQLWLELQRLEGGTEGQCGSEPVGTVAAHPKACQLLPWQHGSQVRSHFLEPKWQGAPISPGAAVALPFSYITQFLSISRIQTFPGAIWDLVALSSQLKVYS